MENKLDAQRRKYALCERLRGTIRQSQTAATAIIRAAAPRLLGESASSPDPNFCCSGGLRPPNEQPGAERHKPLVAAVYDRRWATIRRSQRRRYNGKRRSRYEAVAAPIRHPFF